MSDYTELVKALRLCQFGECGCGKCHYKELKGDWCTEDNHPEFFDCDDKLKLDAAAAIEALQAELEKKRTTDCWGCKCEKVEPKRGEFEKSLHEMFDSIWDCDINHPIFQDTVGELMEAVLKAYDTVNRAKMEVQDG